MLDTTLYTDKLPPSLNKTLKSFTGSECVLVNKIKNFDKPLLDAKAGNCHLNVRNYIDAYGGSSVSGWILNRTQHLLLGGMYVWTFHSVWIKPDNKVVDVTDDLNYKGKDKITFIPDSARVADLTEGLFYNNVIILDGLNNATLHKLLLNEDLKINTPYWCNTSMNQFFSLDEHSGIYRSISARYPNNEKVLADEYGVDIVNRKLVARLESNNSNMDFIKKLVFDFSLSN
jgi:hypothetical protein